MLPRMRHLLLQIAASAGVLLLAGLWPQTGRPFPPAPPPGGILQPAPPGEAWRIPPPAR
jgi:hypothetical protein